MTELLTCPFCGGAAEFEEIPEVGARTGVTWSVGCGNADEVACPGYQLMTSWPTKGAAAGAWNRRSASPAARSEPAAEMGEAEEKALCVQSARLFLGWPTNFADKPMQTSAHLEERSAELADFLLRHRIKAREIALAPEAPGAQEETL
jgi:hypothetical protein